MDKHSAPRTPGQAEGERRIEDQSRPNPPADKPSQAEGERVTEDPSADPQG